MTLFRKWYVHDHHMQQPELMDPKTLLTNPTNWSMQSSKNYALMKLVLMNICLLYTSDAADE